MGPAAFFLVDRAVAAAVAFKIGLGQRSAVMAKEVQNGESLGYYYYQWYLVTVRVIIN